MFDATLRRIIDPPLDRIGRRLAGAGVSASGVTVVGFAIGLLAIPCLAAEWYGSALAAIPVNRPADGLDGAVARHTTLTDSDGSLDTVRDFIFYAGVAFGFALPCRPDHVRAVSVCIVW
jgi:phosphatidylserine synthase